MPGSPHHPRTQPFPPARAGKDGEHNITQLCNPRGEPLRVALAHDWLCGLRGGEHVLEDCIAALTGAGACITGLYVMFDDGRSLAPGIDQQQTYSSGLGKLPGASTHLRKHLLPLYPLAVHQLSRLIAAHQPRHRADLLLSTSSSAVKGISVRGLHIPHISYIHSPARYLWGRGDEYAMGKGGWLRSLGLNLFGPWLRRWDRRTAANADHLLANSTHTSQLITSAWGRDADVMFPGVPTEHFSPPSGTVPAQRDGSWLIVSALEPYKRIDLALGAADRAGARLTIVGDGSQRSALEALARTCVKATITFTGRIDDAALRAHYQRASAFLYPQLEDFGITAVEAQAAGVPIAAYAAGGALDSVIDGTTGVYFREQTPEALAAAARACVELARMPETAAACSVNAQRFAQGRFRSELVTYVDAAMRSYVSPQCK